MSLGFGKGEGQSRRSMELRSVRSRRRSVLLRSDRSRMRIRELQSVQSRRSLELRREKGDLFDICLEDVGRCRWTGTSIMGCEECPRRWSDVYGDGVSFWRE